MNEYVIDLTTTKEMLDAGKYFEIPGEAFRENIVRCKDCKYGRRTITLNDLKPGAIECCNAYMHRIDTVLVPDDGFCKWGDRRE